MVCVDRPCPATCLFVCLFRAKQAEQVAHRNEVSTCITHVRYMCATCALHTMIMYRNTTQVTQIGNFFRRRMTLSRDL